VYWFFFAKINQINERIHPPTDSKPKNPKPNNKGSKLFEWEEVIDRIAKEYFNDDWDKVTDLNIYTFSHRCDYLTNKLKKEYLNSKKNSVRRR
jgi:hypothetical protein